jgi:hypothetical protein
MCGLYDNPDGCVECSQYEKGECTAEQEELEERVSSLEYQLKDELKKGRLTHD